MSRKNKPQVELEQKKPVLRKTDYMIAVTEEEYDAHRDELEEMNNVVIFVDEADHRHWMASQCRLDYVPDQD